MAGCGSYGEEVSPPGLLFRGVTTLSCRAETRLSCIVLQPLPGNPSCTRVTWLLSMDLKVSSAVAVPPCWPRAHHPSCISLPQGWIPTSVTNRVLPQCQAKFIGHLRQHLSSTASL